MAEQHTRGGTVWCASFVFRQGFSGPQMTTNQRRAFVWPGRVPDGNGEGHEECAMRSRWNRMASGSALVTAAAWMADRATTVFAAIRAADSDTKP